METEQLKHGIVRMANNFPESQRSLRTPRLDKEKHT